MKFSKKDAFTIPNILTYVRLLCLPFFLWMMFAYYADPSRGEYLWAGFGLFVFASATDIADGWIARHFNMVSDIGKVLDPVADKLLQCFAMLTLGIIGNMHWAFIGIIIFKEIFIGVTSKYFMRASKRQVEQMANKWGKAAAFTNFIGITLAFLVNLHEAVYYVDLVILIAGSVLAVIAAVQYTYKYEKSLLRYKRSGILDELDPNGEPLGELTLEELKVKYGLAEPSEAKNDQSADGAAEAGSAPGEDHDGGERNE